MIERIIHTGFMIIVAVEMGRIVTCGTFQVLKAFPVPAGKFPLNDYNAGYGYICDLEAMGYITPIKTSALVAVIE